MREFSYHLICKLVANPLSRNCNCKEKVTNIKKKLQKNYKINFNIKFIEFAYHVNTPLEQQHTFNFLDWFCKQRLFTDDVSNHRIVGETQ